MQKLTNYMAALYAVLDKPWKPDSFKWLLLILGSISIVFVYSASITASTQATGFGASFALKQAIYYLLGGLAFLLVTAIPLNLVKRLSLLGFLASTAFLIAVLIPGIGKEVNGAYRWINLGIVNFQPSEFAKLVVVILVAHVCATKRVALSSTNWSTMKPALLPIAVCFFPTVLLLLMEPDFGSSAVVSVIVLAIMMLAGLRKRIIFSFGIGIAILGAALIASSPYRMKRFMGFLDPWADPYGKSYQLTHSLMAYGQGGLSGTGLGTSIEAQFYLPEAHTDFISAIIAEETGAIGISLVALVLLLLIFQCIAIGKYAIKQDKIFEGLIAQGIGVWFAFQTSINLGVATGLLPTKGITLPFISYGGSGVVFNLIAAGLVYRVLHESTKIIGSSEQIAFDVIKKGMQYKPDWMDWLTDRLGGVLRDPSIESSRKTIRMPGNISSAEYYSLKEKEQKMKKLNNFS